VEDRVDLEGEREERRHGGQVEWGVEEKEWEEEEEEAGRWRDSVAPKHVARLSLAMSGPLAHALPA